MLAEVRPILEVAASLGIPPEELIPWGYDKAKVRLSLLTRPRQRARPARLILVSAMTPTPAGEGKTTTSIGLAQGLTRLGESACLALREPSLGPCMGQKGGGTGGGRSHLVPAEDINLHFTGDFHAVTSAHNLLAALIDNHLHHGNALGLDVRRIAWRRVLDLNDRALREVVVGLGGPGEGVPRQTGFDITPASEIMAILCLADGEADLRARLERMIVGTTAGGEVVRAAALGATGALMALLRDAMLPNLVQTVEGTPALVHGGPFANIAHGCNSVAATRMALHLADWAVTEAGFGFDLGAEKFFDIKCRAAGLDTAAVVLVATVRALKMHGGRALAARGEPDAEAVERGLPNLIKHIENIACFGERPVVALNLFGDEREDEIALVRAACASLGVPFAPSDHFARGGEGALELARAVMAHAEATPSPFRPLYPLSASIEDKVLTVAQRMYGAAEVAWSPRARRELAAIEALGLGGLPVCMAKTQRSLSDDTRLLGRPEGFTLHVDRAEVSAGAGFVVIMTGDILRMPGLPRSPQAERLDLLAGRIVGLR